MNDTINITVKTGKDWLWKLSGLYDIDVDGRELNVGQKCIDRIFDLCEGKFDVEFDEGEVIVYGTYPRSKPPHTCIDCGKRIPFCRTWCDPCLNKMLKGYR